MEGEKDRKPQRDSRWHPAGFLKFYHGFAALSDWLHKYKDKIPSISEISRDGIWYTAQSLVLFKASF
jgi:hypothetical protein